MPYTRLTDHQMITAPEETGAVSRPQHEKNFDIPSVCDFGAVGDDSTNNSAAFDAMEASDIESFFVPAGIFKSYKDPYASLTKKYWGSGFIKGYDGNQRGRFLTNISAPLDSRANTSDHILWYTGDWSNCLFSGELLITSPIIQTGSLVTSTSAASGTYVLTFSSVPSWVGVGVSTGYPLGVSGTGIASGCQVSAVTSTTVTLTLATTATISSGVTISFGIGDYIQPFEASPANMSIYAANGSLNSNMNSIGSGGQVVHAYNANVKNDSGGGGLGGFYGLVNISRAYSGYSSSYPYNTAAGWLMSGKVMANCTNPYLTGIEFELNDNGNPSTAIGIVIDFARQGTPAGNHHFWSGIEMNFGANTVAATRWMGGAGMSAMGIDFSRANFTLSAKPAIVMLPDQKIMLAATAGTYSPSSVGTSSIYFSSGANKVLIESSGAQFQFDSTGALYLPSATGAVYINGTQVLGSRKTGWTAATGTATRTTFVTSSVTTAVLAEHVKALIDDLISSGVIGA